MAAARDLRGAARHAAYAAGQAGAVAHVAAHELGAAAYAIKAASRVPSLILVSQRLTVVPTDPIIAKAVARTVIVTCAGSDRGRREALAEVTPVIVSGRDTVDLAGAREALAERGLRRLVCEGGPTLFGTALGAGIVDELCLTLSPMLTGPGAGRIVSSSLRVDPAAPAAARAGGGRLPVPALRPAPNVTIVAVRMRFARQPVAQGWSRGSYSMATN